MTEKEYVDYLLEKAKCFMLDAKEYRDLQYFLIRNYVSYSSNYPVCETAINTDKMLFISDTHIGSEYENKKFIDGAYNYAIGNNIETVIHTGDFVEGQVRKRERTLEDLRNEIIKALQMIPAQVRIKLLFGNHDFSVFNAYAYPSLLDLFFLHPNLDILGLGRVILNWNNVPIGLSHYISDKLVHFNSDITKEILTVEGHSHLYFANELNNVIKVPSLSDELKDSGYYAKRSLAQWGITLHPLIKPYLNFLKASFVDENTILFEELRQDSLGYINSCEKVQINVLSKEMKKYKS